MAKRTERTTLDEDAILDAALRLIRHQGVQKLGMRAIARELGVSPMAIYHHIPSKAVLLDRIRASVIGLVPANTRAALASSAAAEAQPSLTAERIIEAGLELVREHGAHKLSMRGLAKHLGVSPMALYHHVPTRDDLLDRLRDSVLNRVELPEPSRAQWRKQLRDCLRQTVVGLSEYPGLIRPGIGRRMTEGDRRIARYGYDVLVAAGFDPQQAGRAVLAYHAQGLGFLVMADEIARLRTAPKKRARGRTRPRAEGQGEFDFASLVEFGIDALLHGLEDQLAQAQRAPARRKRAKRAKR